MSILTIIELAQDSNWKANIGPTINPVPSDAFDSFVDKQGDLDVINEASKEMAGGLISDNEPIPVGAKYFGLDVAFDISAEDLPHYGRGENDLKITFPGGLQANASCEWNPDSNGGNWQLDPTGKTWVDTGYKAAPVAGRNTLQIRIAFDGTKWSVTGLRVNGGAAFTPDAAVFANLPAIQTNWSAGLHPQLQTEVKGAPWFLREIYERVRVLASDEPIAWEFAL